MLLTKTDRHPADKKIRYSTNALVLGALTEFSHSFACVDRDPEESTNQPSAQPPSQDKRMFQLLALCPERKLESPLRGRCAALEPVIHLWQGGGWARGTF